MALLLTFGAALVIEEAIRAVLGSTEKQLPMPDALGRVHARRLLFAQIPAVRLRRSPPAAIAPSGLFLERTPYGAIIKAGAHDSEMVRALGINLARLRLVRLRARRCAWPPSPGS